MQAINYNLLEGINNELIEIISGNAIITITDALGRLEYANQNYCKIMECDARLLIGETHELLKSHLHANKVYKNLWKTLKAGKKWSGVLSDISAAGNLYWLDTTIIPIKHIEENRIKYVAIHKDVTKYQLENTQLLECKKAYAKYMSIYQSMDVGVIVVTNDVGNITEWNKGAELAFGYTKAEILGHPLSVLMSIKYRKGNIKELLCAIDKIKECQSADRIEISCIRKNGNEFPVEFKMNSLSFDNNNFYCVSMLDITKRKELENRLTLKTKILELFLKRSKSENSASSEEELLTIINNQEVKKVEAEVTASGFKEKARHVEKLKNIVSNNKSNLSAYDYNKNKKQMNLDPLPS
jgi:PAS domain S-box-containing protein